MTEFKWDENRRLAAQLIANGELTDAQIAERVGVVRTTLWNWRQESEFAGRVEADRDQVRRSIERRAISMRERRVDRLNRDWLRLQRVFDARGADPAMAGVPGGETGLMVRKYKTIGSGEFARQVEEYEVDTGALNELRQMEKQAAIELGQWEERQAITGLAEIHELMEAYLDPDEQPEGDREGAGVVPPAGEPA